MGAVYAVGIMTTGERILLAISVLLTLAALGGLIWLIRADTLKRARCTDNGGTIVKYNCHTTWIDVSCGSGCTVQIPTEDCLWRCEGANAEAE